MRSCAQAEDVRLARVLRGRTDGLYIDVGAAHPVHDSVTKHFYDAGWTGIDIEERRRGSLAVPTMRAPISRMRSRTTRA